MYVGIIIQDKDIISITKALLKIKKENGIDKNRPIKWSSNR